VINSEPLHHFTDAGECITESANYAFTDFTIAPVNVIDPLNVTAASISADCSMDAMYPSAV